MKPDYWFRQTADKPLFPDLLWSQPENKAYAGKLLIVGGSAHGFAAPAEAFRYAERAGIGVIRMLLPEPVQKYVGKAFDAGNFAPATPSGSFAQRGLAELLDLTQWANAVLLAGDFGKNSETAMLLEKFAATCPCALALTGDAIDYFLAMPGPVLDRDSTLLALDFTQLQKLAIGAHFNKAFTSQLDFLHFIELVHGFANQHRAHLIVNHLGHTIIASQGQVSTTPTQAISALEAASQASVWWLQNLDKPFEAMTTSLVAS